MHYRSIVLHHLLHSTYLLNRVNPIERACTGLREKYSEMGEIGEEDVKVDFMLKGQVDRTFRTSCRKEGRGSCP